MSLNGEDLPDSLHAAIGKVATASAHMEDILRSIVAFLTGSVPEGWLVFEGQSTDWLLQNGQAVLGQPSSRFKPESVDHMRSLFREAVRLKNDRNLVVHGTWMANGDDGSGYTPRSAGTLDASEIFTVARSRFRKRVDWQSWSLADVEELAAEIRALVLQLYKSPLFDDDDSLEDEIG